MRQRVFITNPPTEPDLLFTTINRMAAEAQQFYSLIAALNIRLFDHLDVPVSLDDLRQLVPHSDMIPPLLGILVDCGFISEDEAMYQNTQVASTYFTTQSPYYQGAYLEKIRKKISELWVNLPDVIRNGPVVYDKKEFFCDMCLPPMAENAMTGRLQHVVRSIVAMPEFLSAHKMLDLGGGHGLYSIALASLKRDLISIVFDLPEVTDTTCDYIIAHDMDEQVKVFPGNFFTDELGTGYDLILSSSNPSGKKTAMISKIYNALAPGGIFVNIQSSDTDIVDNPISQLERKMWMVDGEPEWKSHKGKQPFLSDSYVYALRECGFEIKQVEQIPDLCKDDFMVTMIICKKKEQMRPAPSLRITLLSRKQREQTVTLTVDTQDPDWLKTLSLMGLSSSAEERQKS
ncbi:class I SAM-dependent methyltransferase [uncultured Methanospirillum sp.]|uniref:class I SAM-dependent methyltransferase n=1 Tax=uncultured Methanospirillum sp. TaxID=262503 RepID=UPI0029C8A451|nr:class I SAM-dependent methyltransferase [uncultured Methanospirillum sp.]